MVMNCPGNRNDVLLTGDVTVQDNERNKGLSHWGETVVRRESIFPPSGRPKRIVVRDEQGAVVDGFVLGRASGSRWDGRKRRGK
jgi:hypothetical protein